MSKTWKYFYQKLLKNSSKRAIKQSKYLPTESRY